jgi:hypothetical protein
MMWVVSFVSLRQELYQTNSKRSYGSDQTSREDTPQQVNEVQHFIALDLQLVVVEECENEEIQDYAGQPNGHLRFDVVGRAYLMDKSVNTRASQVITPTKREAW